MTTTDVAALLLNTRDALAKALDKIVALESDLRVARAGEALAIDARNRYERYWQQAEEKIKDLTDPEDDWGL